MNPIEPATTAPVDPKIAKRVDSLYRNCKQMPMLCVLSLVVPILLPFVAPLCIVYAMQRKQLLAQLDEQGIGKSPRGALGEFDEQVAYLQYNGNRFLFPIIIAVVVAVVVGVFVLTMK